MVYRSRVGICLILSMALLFFLGLGQAQGSSLLFNRDLPVYNEAQPNLNNIAGDYRCNNRFYQDLGTEYPTEYMIPGDDFTIGEPGQVYHIDTIRIWATEALPWTIDPVTEGQVWMGPADGSTASILPISITYTWIPVKYSNNAYYQTVEGGWRQLIQVDVAVDMNIQGGQKYWFFVDGIYYSPINEHYYTANLHASNAALSNATEEGADNVFHWLTLSDGSPILITDQTSILPSGLGGDGNVQIYGELVPLPPSLLFLGSGLLGLLGWQRFRRR